MSKYILLLDDKRILFGRTLYRIKYLRDCGWATADDLGGYIESEDNFSHDDESWIGERACVFDGAIVKENAKVYGTSWVYQNSTIKGNSSVFDYAIVRKSSVVMGNSKVFGSYVLENEVLTETQKRVTYVY